MRRALVSFLVTIFSVGLFTSSALAMPVCDEACASGLPAHTTPTPSKPKPRPRADWIIVRPGDTLSGIGARVHRSWQALGAFNHVADPNVIMQGQHLRLPPASWEPPENYGVMAAAPPAPAPKPAPTYWAPTPTTTPVTSAPPVQPTSSSGSVGGAFGDCVRQRESGGNYQVTNSSGHYGAYQFSYSTWVAYGGSSGAFGNASPAEQDQVFANAIAKGGQSAWTPYDGC